jgi:hypothetical protein
MYSLLANSDVNGQIELIMGRVSKQSKVWIKGACQECLSNGEANSEASESKDSACTVAGCAVGS